MPYFKIKEIFFMFLNKIHVVSNMPRLKPRFGVRYIASSQTWEGILHFGRGLHDGYYDNWLSQFFYVPYAKTLPVLPWVKIDRLFWVLPRIGNIPAK